MQKSVAKSIRMTEKIYDYINRYPGNGFNEKFENIILYAMESEQERVQELKRLDKQIIDKRDQIIQLELTLNKVEPIVHIALRVNSLVKEFHEKFKNILED